MTDCALVGIANVGWQVGNRPASSGGRPGAPDADADAEVATSTWRQRREVMMDKLSAGPVIRPHGGWSLFIDTAELGLSPHQASERLLDRGRLAATPMAGSGPSGERYLRLVFANEPIERLQDNEPIERLHDVRSRFDASFG